MQKTWIQSLGQEDPLEEEMAAHFSILAWRIPMDRGARWAAVHGVAKSQTRHSIAIKKEACPSKEQQLDWQVSLQHKQEKIEDNEMTVLKCWGKKSPNWNWIHAKNSL